jgi:hypothetical protein
MKELVSLADLARATKRVIAELKSLGLWDDLMDEVGVYLSLADVAHGRNDLHDTGHITVPSMSWARMPWQGKVPLIDVLRHEYGHAFANKHPKLIRDKRFREAFGAAHKSSTRYFNDPEVHISKYSEAFPASEDFAEVFMLYLKHKGRLPARHDTPTIRGKWEFVVWLARQVG